LCTAVAARKVEREAGGNDHGLPWFDACVVCDLPPAVCLGVHAAPALPASKEEHPPKVYVCDAPMGPKATVRRVVPSPAT
jgi:hypothetical protein